MKNIGLYIHIPFCKSVCPYCDFYRFRATDEKKEEYVYALIREIKDYGDKFSDKIVDTIYFGGGTPTVLPPKLFAALIKAVRESFKISKDVEFTVEANPSTDVEALLPILVDGGVNRISFGMQSAVDSERRQLGRLSGTKRVTECVELISKSGIENISLDLMIGIPNQTSDSLSESLAYIKEIGVPHVSAYMLKLEEGTYFYRNADKLMLPSDDETADLYLQMCEFFDNIGLKQYEISNFAKPSFESKHNLKYWHCEEYLGIGCAAHSYIDGKRFYYDRDIDAFIASCEPHLDTLGGDFNERLMLALRLTEGYVGELPERVIKKASSPIYKNLLVLDDKGIHLTRKGMLVSNEIISRLMD